MEIVWVFGSSAVGKATFIKYVSQNPKANILTSLGWNDKTIVPIWESINFVGNSIDDSVKKKRDTLVEKVVSSYSQEEGIILIKGQDYDLFNKFPSRLKSTIPEAQHTILFLHTNDEELFRRFKSKQWWRSRFTKKVMGEWQSKQIRLIQGLQGFNFKSIDTTTQDYQLSDFFN